MISKIETRLFELTNIAGLSGHEDAVRKYMEKEFMKAGFTSTTDVHGNCIVKIKGKKDTGGPVMIFAHMDSLGFLVKGITDEGYIRMERLGGIPEKVLPATDVVIKAENGHLINGVIGSKSHHITPPSEKYVVQPYSSLFIDVGANSKKEVLEMGIEIGCPIVYTPKFKKLANNFVQATALDDRAGCAVLLMLADYFTNNTPNTDIYIVATVQEEYNLRGAMMASRSFNPKAAICIDCAPGEDTPDLLETGGETKLGGGPVISKYNFHGRGTLNGTIAHPAMVRIIKEAASRSGIPLQNAAYIGALTDMAYLQLEGKGVIGIDIGFPIRYAHSPSEVCNMDDLVGLSKLLEAVVNSIDENTDWSR